MPKLIRKERNVVYEYYEVEITDEEAKQFRNDDENFTNKIYNDELDFQYKHKIDGSSREVYYVENDEEPIMD